MSPGLWDRPVAGGLGAGPPDLPADRLLDDLRLLLADGSHRAGAEVYRYAMRRIWWAWPLYLFATIPGGRQVFDWGYRTFARHRHRVSDACGLR